MPHALIARHNPVVARLIAQRLERRRWEVSVAYTVDEACQMHSRRGADLLLLELSAPTADSMMRWYAELDAAAQERCVFMVGSRAAARRAAEAGRPALLTPLASSALYQQLVRHWPAEQRSAG